MANLIIDIGNTTAKLAVYQDSQRVSDVVIVEHTDLITTIEKFKSDEIVVASVVKFDLNFKHKKITNQCRFPFEIAYKTPETLGIDRLAGVTACYEKHDKENFLLIDFGTMITVEFFVDGKYLGGNISPGVRSRFNAVNRSAPRLPLLNKDAYSQAIGNSTNSAIAAGVINSIVFEIEGYIRFATTEFPQIKKIIFTGGNAQYICSFLKNINFASIIIDPTLVLDGIAVLNKYNLNI